MANMNTYFIFINHIAICMCNILKCRFKHPVPYIRLRLGVHLFELGPTTITKVKGF